MDLVADMLLRSLRTEHAADIAAVELRPRMRTRFASAPLLSQMGFARNANRLVSRFLDYPRWLKDQQECPSVYHIVDHSYAHLAHALPAGRTVVTCHDLDTFRSIIEPRTEPRSWPFRAMTRRILTGLQSAARVTCDSVATRDGIIAHGLLPAHKLEVVPLGVDPLMTPDANPEADEFVTSLLGGPGRARVDLLHVGSTIARKRIDVLLRTFAAVQSEYPSARLIRVGGPFTDAQQGVIEGLRIEPSTILALPRLDRAQLAAVYRRASLLLQPSGAEGFGLPVVEAMACGVPVVASDLPVLREVGGPAAEYCAVGDIAAWSGTVCAMVRERRDDPASWDRRRRAALQQAGRFSWSRFAASLADVYRAVASASIAGGL